MRPFGLFGALLGAALAFGSLATRAERSWPQFRGQRADGVVPDEGFPGEWSTRQNVAWAVEIPGCGWSSPIVWESRIYLTSVINSGHTEPPKKGLYFGGERLTPSPDKHFWMVWCLDFETGNVCWKAQVHEGPPASSIHLKNTYASETPVTDGERVYAYFGNTGLFCLDVTGKEIWSKKLGVFKTRFGWGTASSPVLHGDRLYLVSDNDEQSFLVAFDKRSGNEVWRINREEKSNWATPYVWATAQRTELVVPGRQRVRSYGLDGTLLWELGGMSSIVIPTPFAHEGLLYVCSGYVGDRSRPVFAIRPGAKGDISLKPQEDHNTWVAWRQPAAGPYNPSPLAYGEYLYVLFDFGFLACYDARTGREIYPKQRLNATGTSAFTASPWAWDGKVFCLSEDGETFVVQAGPEFKLVRRNHLDEMSLATPAIARGSLFIRTATKLYRICQGP